MHADTYICTFTRLMGRICKDNCPANCIPLLLVSTSACTGVLELQWLKC